MQGPSSREEIAGLFLVEWKLGKPGAVGSGCGFSFFLGGVFVFQFSVVSFFFIFQSFLGRLSQMIFFLERLLKHQLCFAFWAIWDVLPH